jgi:hypothetical protein
MLPLLVPLAIQILPQIGKWLFGDKAADTIKQVGDVVSQVTGVADPHSSDGLASVEAVLQGKPELAAQIQVQLAQIAATREAEANRAAEAQRAADVAQIQATIADTDSARKQTMALAASGSAIAWGAPIVSTLVLFTFGVVMWLAMTKALPPGSETILNMLLGTLGAMAVSVVSYWVGSSAGSARKDATIGQQSRDLASSTPVS